MVLYMIFVSPARNVEIGETKVKLSHWGWGPHSDFHVKLSD